MIEEAPALRNDGLLRTEDVAYWFFRLNGCLTMVNFVVHPDFRASQRTDADILAVRFPWRTEQDMVDHDLFGDAKTVMFLLSEVKLNRCQLNGPWARPSDNLERIISAVGVVPRDQVDGLAGALYARRVYRTDTIEARLVLVGDEVDTEYEHRYPGVAAHVAADLPFHLSPLPRLAQYQEGPPSMGPGREAPI